MQTSATPQQIWNIVKKSKEELKTQPLFSGVDNPLNLYGYFKQYNTSGKVTPVEILFDTFLQNLNYITSGSYVLPIATSAILGAVIIGKNVNVTSAGVISVDFEADTTNYINNNYTTINNVKDALDKLLRLAPTIVTFIGGSINELGTVISSINFSWTLSGDNSQYSTLTDVLPFYINNISSYVLSGISLSADKTYTLTIGDTTLNPSSTANTIVHFTNRMFYGNSSNLVLNSSQIIGLGNSFLTDTRLTTITLNGAGNYLHICYPTSYGLPEIWMGGFLDSSWVTNIVSFTNSLGYTSNYYDMRSKYLQNGTGISIEIR
jgi:hypothetical protein